MGSAGRADAVNLWRLAFIALASALVGLAMGAGATYVARPRVPLPVEVAVPIALTLAPKAPPRWPRWKASIRRFLKIFVFVGSGLVIAALLVPNGLLLILEPYNAFALLLGSTLGAFAKYVTWTDVTAEVPPTVTLALTPATAPAAPAAPEGEVQ